jgi:hypothetical protein
MLWWFYKKICSEEPSRNFAVRLRRLVTKKDFPRYAMKLTRTADGAEAVYFIARHYLESRGQTIESKGASAPVSGRC